MTTTTEKYAEQLTAAAKKRMGTNFAVFNCHVNDAKNRADAEFIAQFGQEKFDEVMTPLHEAGIMEIFNEAPTIYTMAWVTLCAAYVNEDVEENA